MKTFNIPSFYRSGFIGSVKQRRKSEDPRKQDFSPTVLNFGTLEVMLARHFGFCYGVENAIEKAYQALEENPGKRIFLLSQMIHNPEVNKDLEANGIAFIQDTYGNQLMDWKELNSEDVVIIPAFGTTIELERRLEKMGIETQAYNTTCPFVEKVWNRSAKLGKENSTVIIHGKPTHEETRATFSHSASGAHSIVIKDMTEAEILGKIILGEEPMISFSQYFSDRTTDGFLPSEHLKKVGVVNQTTMLASETQAIADYFKSVMEQKYGTAEVKNHFVSTRDTLCYATNDNQQATYALLDEKADVAIVVGGYNSSNTSHLVELCETKLPTYFIKNETEMLSETEIQHFNWREKKMIRTEDWLPQTDTPRIIITSGASCPDTVLERVMIKLLSYFPTAHKIDEVEKLYM